MPQIKVTLGIGYPTASHEDVIDVEDVEWDECKTDEERENLMGEYWQDWANNYIDGSYKLIE